MPDFTAGPPELDPERFDHLDRRPDPDLDVLAQGGDSELDDLRAELTAALVDTTTIEVPGRPGYAVRCRLDFTGRDLDLLRKRARDKKFTDGIDGIRFACLTIASYCTSIVRNGEPLDLGDGKAVNFTHPEFQGLYGTTDAVSTVRALFVREGHIDAAVKRLLEEAGWGDEAYTVDPTQ